MSWLAPGAMVRLRLEREDDDEANPANAGRHIIRKLRLRSSLSVSQLSVPGNLFMLGYTRRTAIR